MPVTILQLAHKTHQLPICAADVERGFISNVKHQLHSNTKLSCYHCSEDAAETETTRSERLFVGCLLACLTSLQHASVSQAQICSNSFTSSHTEIHQAMELRVEKSAEKWGSGGCRRPPVVVQGATPPVGVRGRRPLKLKLFNKK